jgi:hypothetical protein
VVLYFSLPVEVDFSFLAEEEPDAARAEAAALVQVLAWLPALVEEEQVCFEGAALAADAPAAGLVVGVAAAELVAAVVVAALRADAAALEPLTLQRGVGLACSGAGWRLRGALG